MKRFINKPQLRAEAIMMLYYMLIILGCIAIVLGSILIVLSDQLYGAIGGWVSLVLLGGDICTIFWLLWAVRKFEFTFEHWRKLRRRYKKQFRMINELEPKDFIP